jgi:hypothetical protein
MDDAGISRQIRDLKDSLRAIEWELRRRKDPPPGLAEFKSAIDDVRSNLIAALTTSDSQSYEASIWKFRANRALGLFQNLVADVVGLTNATVSSRPFWSASAANRRRVERHYRLGKATLVLRADSSLRQPFHLL